MRSLALFVFMLVYVNSSVVTVNKTSPELSVTASTESGTKYVPDYKSDGLVKHTTAMPKVKYQDRVYLEDVLYNLKSQNWTKDEEPCYNHTMTLLKSLQNFTLWAVWEWDATSSEPTGLLFGNGYQLGNFDECLETPWQATNPEIRSQYCLANIKLERSDHTNRHRRDKSINPYSSALDFIEDKPRNMRPLNEVTWGICVPATCQPESVKRLVDVMVARSHLGNAGLIPHISIDEKCQRADQPATYDGPFYAYMVVIGCLFVISLFCTYFHCSRHEEDSRITTRIAKTFCLKTNAASLLEVKRDGIEVMYGIRFLTICLITLDHQFAMTAPIARSNGRNVDRATMSALGMMMVHNDLFVDTFFVLSSFLVATNLFKVRRFPNPVFVILKRYVRLVIAFAVVTFFMASVFPYIGNGPIWPRVVQGESDTCRKNWWINLLMLNNYIDSENMCMVIAWYIPCDFHYFVITVLLIWMHQSYPTISKACAGIIAVASVLVPGIITYVNQLPAVQLFTYDFTADPRGSEQLQLTYIKSHTRSAAYVIGLACGYIFAKCQMSGNLNRISKKWSIIGAVVGIIIMVVVMVGGSVFLLAEYNLIVRAVYAATNRAIWALGLGLFILCCALGTVPMVTGFLSWYPWVPLSRLSYGLYLTHFILIFRSMFIARNSEHTDYGRMTNEAAGTIFWGCIFSFLIWLLTEAPAKNLLDLLLLPRRKLTQKDQSQEQGSQNTIVSAKSEGHIHGNLPTTVTLSSKI